jgi:hypothetical protein
MATCRQVVTSALRKLGVVAEGQPAPTAYDADNGLSVLESVYLTSVASGLFGRLTDVTISEDYTAGENERIFNITEDTLTVSYPVTITDAKTGVVRMPLDRSIIQVADVSPTTHVYSHIVGDWIEMTNLTLDSVAPLTDQGMDGMACWLAVVLAENGYGSVIGPVTLRTAERFRGAQALRVDATRLESTPDFF